MNKKMPVLGRKALNIFIILVLAYFTLITYIFFAQKHYIYFPNNQDFAVCSGFADADALDFQGTRFYYKNNSERIVVFYHGNAGSACDRAHLKPFFEANNLSYAFVEYTGYSNDNRRPSEEALFKDAENIHAFVASLNASEIIVMGESLGSAIAAHHASLGSVNALALIAPFSSLADVARYHQPYLPFSLILRERYDNRAALWNFRGRTLIIHGTNDDTIPLHLSESLFEALPSATKERVTIEGAGHNDLYAYERTFDALNEFVKKG